MTNLLKYDNAYPRWADRIVYESRGVPPGKKVIGQCPSHWSVAFFYAHPQQAVSTALPSPVQSDPGDKNRRPRSRSNEVHRLAHGQASRTKGLPQFLRPFSEGAWSIGHDYISPPRSLLLTKVLVLKTKDLKRMGEVCEKKEKSGGF